MKNLLYVLVILLVSSCGKNSDIVSADFLSGKWQVQTIKVDLKMKDPSENETVNEDFSKDKYIFNFNSDGTYTVSIDAKTKDKFENLSGEVFGNENGGMYKVANGYITFDTNDDDGKISQKQTLTKTNANNITISIDRALLFENIKTDFEKNAAAFALFGIDLKSFLKELEAEILDYKQEIKLKKVS